MHIIPARKIKKLVEAERMVAAGCKAIFSGCMTYDVISALYATQP